MGWDIGSIKNKVLQVTQLLALVQQRLAAARASGASSDTIGVSVDELVANETKLLRERAHLIHRMRALPMHFRAASAPPAPAFDGRSRGGAHQ